MALRDTDERVTFDDVMIEHKTDSALLCVIDNQKHWIPYSQIDEEESELTKESSKRDVGMLVISEWLAIEKGLV
jgi:hypothetical protein